ncbi:MAG: hypothetical protein Q8Q86_02230, partial [Candidatus Daviesbacteria bacterium]|nr:hypothetical protein [Candidatus Daviesbacteria bacterium]
MTNTRLENSNILEIEDGFKGEIYDAKIFCDFIYLDASKKVQDGLTEHRTYLYFDWGKFKLIKRGFEDKSIPKIYK